MTHWLQLGFLALFVIVAIGLMFLHPRPEPVSAVDPKALCEQKGDWWDDQDKVCAVPTPLSTMTGRPAGTH